MFFVYQLEFVHYPRERYTGFTEDVDTRLATHNNGQSARTAKENTAKNFDNLALRECV